MTSAWKCAVEDAGRRGAERCQAQCAHCLSSDAPSTKTIEVHKDPNRPLTKLETFTGAYFDFLDPRPQDIRLADIARALSQTCRFGGHVSKFLSVSEHSVYVRNAVLRNGYPELALAALFHDAHEAYILDIPTPLKVALGDPLARLRTECDKAIGAKFGIAPHLFEHPVIQQADLEALFREAASLKPSQGVGIHWGRTEALPPIPEAGLAPRDAETLFLNAYEELAC